MIHITCMVGSISQRSSSLSLANHFRTHFSNDFEIDIISVDLPHYNSDIDKDGLRPQQIIKFYEALEKSDAYLFVTPEYNNSIPGVLKNAIDWASRNPHFKDKPALVVANTMGKNGGGRAYIHMIDILHRIPLHVMPGHDILVTDVRTKFTDETLSDPATITFIESVMKQFKPYVEKLK